MSIVDNFENVWRVEGNNTKYCRFESLAEIEVVGFRQDHLA